MLSTSPGRPSEIALLTVDTRFARRAAGFRPHHLLEHCRARGVTDDDASASPIGSGTGMPATPTRCAGVMWCWLATDLLRTYAEVVTYNKTPVSLPSGSLWALYVSVPGKHDRLQSTSRLEVVG